MGPGKLPSIIPLVPIIRRGLTETKLVAMAMSLEESEKLDWIKTNHANTFCLVERS